MPFHAWECISIQLKDGNQVNLIIKNLNIGNKTLKLHEKKIFVYKDEIPVEQLFALYAINKIASVANEKEVTYANNIIE
jgi:DNA (cytosine-5)-methyltransferase 1